METRCHRISSSRVLISAAVSLEFSALLSSTSAAVNVDVWVMSRSVPCLKTLDLGLVVSKLWSAAHLQTFWLFF